uniref:Uncharacterized protein n=1 Tax=Cacopsylla melanoneura TaxID=428564 RepID=A0A8D8TCB5_9HEMI
MSIINIFDTMFQVVLCKVFSFNWFITFISILIPTLDLFLKHILMHHILLKHFLMDHILLNHIPMYHILLKHILMHLSVAYVCLNFSSTFQSLLGGVAWF